MVCRGTFVAKGRICFFFGPNGEQVIDTEAGNHFYALVGEFHLQLKRSDTETAEYTSTYVGESDRNNLGTVPVPTTPSLRDTPPGQPR